MSTLIDREGTFRVKILEAGVTTSKKGMPQFVAEFQATQKWVDSQEELTAFGLSEAGWVDWSAYDQSIMGYLQLIYDQKDNDGNYTGELKPMFYVEALVDALDWDGVSFNALGTTDWTGKEVTVWVETNEFNGKISLQVRAIGKADASPHRGGVRSLEAGDLLELDAQFSNVLAGGAQSNAAPALAPATAPSAPASVPAAAVAAPVAAKPAAVAPTAASATAPTVATAPAPAAASTTAPSTMSMNDAWALVAERSTKSSDDERAAAWVKACAAVGVEDQDAATDEQWAAVAKSACLDLECPF